MAHRVPREVPIRVPAIGMTRVTLSRDITPLERDLGSSVRALKFKHKDPVRLQLQLNKAKWQIQNGNWAAAAKEAQAGLAIEHPAYPDSSIQNIVRQANSELALLCAHAHNQQRNWGDAIKAINSVSEGQLPETIVFDIFIQRAFALCHDGKTDNALAICDQAIALHTTIPRDKAYALKAHLHNEKGERDEAIAAAKAGNTVKVDDLTKADLANELARAYNGKGIRDEAIAAAQKGLGLREISNQVRAELYFQEARAHLGKGDWDDIIQASNAGLSLFEISDEVAAELWRVKAQAHNENGETDDALAAAKLGLTIDFAKQGTQFMLILQHAKASIARKEWDDVIPLAAKGLQMTVGSDQLKAELCLLKAKAHNANVEDDDVISTATQGVAFNGASDQVKAELYLLKADAHYGKQEYDDVITAGAAGVALTGASVQTKATLNNLKLFAHNAKGEYDNAIATGKAGDALASGSDDGTKGALYYNWGIAHMKKGEWMLAETALTKGTTALKGKFAMRNLRADMHTLIAECWNRHLKKGKTTNGKAEAELAAREALRLRPGYSAAQTQLKIAQGSIRPDGYRDSVFSEIGGVFSRNSPCHYDDSDSD